ncbi:MAG: aspartate-semialdehyde dehydrogenase [Bacteroidetes bacterium 4572_128]|nr:MAG: aspartate-semialdehyde dehydrogenase [Bacteroidetes bacterium 4572_128]
MKIAIVGIGLVGKKILEILEERKISIEKLYLVASERSVGKKFFFKKKEYFLIPIEEALNKKLDIILFSAGSTVSKKFAKKFAKKNIFVIDNSNAWRMDKDIKLIIPEINANILSKKDKIISNPNCSTIQMLIAISDLHKHFKIKRLVISTYQSVTGTGQKAVEQLKYERENIFSKKVYPYFIDKNCIPHCGDFQEDNYTTEEIKLIRETQKILDDKEIKITATAVRVPVEGGHSESVNIEFHKNFDLKKIFEILKDTKGVTVLDDISKNIYPMPILSKNKDDVFVGRIRRDFSQKNTLNLWIVSDNLRKGAATNAVQIAEHIFKMKN